MRHLFSMAVAMFICTIAFGQIPSKISFQGYVTGAGNAPLNGTFSFKFQLYNVATGGTVLWTETQTGVTATNGVINVQLGAVTAITLPFDVPYYLSIQKDTDPAFTPRVALMSAPYSFSSTSVKGSKNVMPSTGNVGIGTTSPGSPLQIGDYSTASNQHMTIATQGGNQFVSGLKLRHFNNDYGWTIESDERLLYGGSSALLFRNHFNNTPGNINVAFLLNGNVGIGTAAPVRKTHIFNSTSASLRLATSELGGGSFSNATESGIIELMENNGTFGTDAAGFKIQYDGLNNLFTVSSSNADPTVIDHIIIPRGTSRVGILRSPTANAFEVEGNASKTTAGSWLANSDRRIKTDIQEIDNSLQLVKQLRPVKFKYKPEYMKAHPSIKDRLYYNFIAQEFQEVFPDAVQSSGEILSDGTDEILQIDTYDAQIVTIRAIQELIVKIEKLEIENKELKAVMTKLESSLSSMKSKSKKAKRNGDYYEQMDSEDSKVARRK